MSNEQRLREALKELVIHAPQDCGDSDCACLHYRAALKKAEAALAATESHGEPVPEGICELCGEPLPEGEKMFRFHGYSGPCPETPKETK